MPSIHTRLKHPIFAIPPEQIRMLSFDGLKLTVALDGGEQILWEFESAQHLNEVLAEWTRVVDSRKADSNQLPR